MSDHFIRELQADWQSEDHDAARILRRLQRNRWTPHLVLAAEILVCVVALLIGLWFAWIAAHNEQHKLLYALSAGILLLTAPALCVAGVMARRPSLSWISETPDALLRVGMRRAESSLRAIRVGRWHLAIIAAFVLTLWVLQALGFIQAIDFLTLYTAVCLAVSVASWLWMRWREVRVRGEHAACAQLLVMLQVEADD
jgi:hypothetical protein